MKKHSVKTIMVAEDVENNYLLIKCILDENKFNVIRAVDGIEAVSLIRAGQIPDLIIMDIRMPKMTGIEATVMIRNLYPDIPIIAVTAYAQESDRDRILDSGFSDYIAKPFSKQLFLSVLSRHLTVEKQ